MTDIHDIKPPIHPKFNPVIFYYILIAILASGLIFLAIILWKRRRKKILLNELAKLSPEEQAFQSLDALMDMDHLEGNEFYYRLSAILKLYIKGRFCFNALEMTTEELLPKVDNLDIPIELKKSVRDLCRSSDSIKYAGLPSIQSKMQADLTFVRKFVKQTTQSDLGLQVSASK